MNKGFTLIEVVVAFAIAALCLGAAAQVFSAAARNAGLAQDRVRALAGAEALLAAAGVAEPLAPGVARGALPGGLRWLRTVEPYLDADDGETKSDWIVYRITVSVLRDAQPVLSLTSLRLTRSQNAPLTRGERAIFASGEGAA